VKQVEKIPGVSKTGIAESATYLPSCQSEPAPMNTPPWMDGWMMDGVWTKHFFSLGSCSPAKLLLAEGSKCVPGVLKLDGLKTGKWGGA